MSTTKSTKSTKTAPATPPDREPTATPISVCGNNAAVACPCGKVIVVPSLYRCKCECGRRYLGSPNNITHILVWDERGATKGPATYRVRAECPNQPKRTRP